MKTLISGRKEQHEELLRGLEVHLGNLFGLMITSQIFHWNVEGPHFISLHKLFEDLYVRLFEEIDVTAERIRACGAYAPETLDELLSGCQLRGRGSPLDADGMLEEMITTIVMTKEFAEKLLKLAGLALDEVTADILIQQGRFLDQTLWMLRSSLPRAGRDYSEDFTDNGVSGDSESLDWSGPQSLS